MCSGCCSCGRRLSDTIFVTCLILVTLYSCHSFYNYIFPNTISSVVNSARSLLGRGDGGVSHRPTRAPGRSLLVNSSGAARNPDVPDPVVLTLWSYALFFISLLLWGMWAWAYFMALWVAPGFIPFTFKQKEKLSASLALNVFYEPLPYRRCSGCERDRRDARAGDGTVTAVAANPRLSGGGRARRRKDVYPPLSSKSLAPENTTIHRFAPPGEQASEAADQAATAVSVDGPAAVVGAAPAVGQGGPRQDDYPSAALSGSSSSDHSAQMHEHFFFNRKANAYTSVKNNYLNFCPLCFSYKPQRAHHCSKCNKCILKYDHHCPWLRQCVGFFNYKNYLLVLLYTLALTSWGVLLLVGALVASVMERRADVWPRAVGRLLQEVRVGAPTGGVFVCLAEALLFFTMTLYLLRRHVFYARHNITTIDIVIHEQERVYGAPLDSADEDGVSGTGADDDGVSREQDPNFMFDNNKKHYRERTLKRFLDKNVFDLGVRRNLLQVFGDAALHRSTGASPPSDDRGVPYFQDLMESDTFLHRRFLARWFWRLLPFRAYPRQVEWQTLDASRQQRRDISGGTSFAGGADDGGGYGATGTCDSFSQTNDQRASFANSVNSNSILIEYGVAEQQLLGLRFPTKASLGL